jgi:type II secretory pathway predicted ATPase ExeA
MTTPLTSQQRRAFLSAPDPRRYYAASAIDESRQRIVRAIARNEGPALVVGAVGTGKSMLLAVLAEQFEPRMSVVRLPGAQLCTRRALLQMILCELRLPYRHMDEGELRLSILEHLRGATASAPALVGGEEASRGAPPRERQSGPGSPAPPLRRMLVLVDEADALPTRLLEELRVLTNVVAQGIPLVSLVLAGGPILEERFADPELEKFSQRLACRCYLAPFTREETFQYVRSQVSAVGVKPESWFDADALAAIHSATGGAPRLVNQLGDQLVWMIEETGCQPLDAALVQQAWSDLQQLPAPWNTDAHSSLSSPLSTSVGRADSPSEESVLEFGELDEPPAVASFAGDADEFEPLASRPSSPLDVFPPPPATAPTGRSSRPRFDDDLPASIPIAAARPRRGRELDDFDASIALAEDLVDQLDEFATLELACDEPDPALEPQAPPAAANPFAEPFADEEILVDPYAGFDVQLLRTAQQVMNRIDRTFAAELARCELRKSKPTGAMGLASSPATTAPSVETPLTPQAEQLAPVAHAPVTATPMSAKAAPIAPAPLPDAVVAQFQTMATSAKAPSVDRPSPARPAPAAVVPGRQFRRLFTSLEAASPRRHQG